MTYKHCYRFYGVYILPDGIANINNSNKPDNKNNDNDVDLRPIHLNIIIVTK